jgi:hypothetical protein
VVNSAQHVALPKQRGGAERCRRATRCSTASIRPGPASACALRAAPPDVIRWRRHDGPLPRTPPD